MSIALFAPTVFTASNCWIILLHAATAAMGAMTCISARKT
jgi:hypothetical protein